MKKWLVVVFLVSAASDLEASGNFSRAASELELARLDRVVSDLESFVLAKPVPRRSSFSSDSSEGSNSSASSATTVESEAQRLNLPLFRAIAAARALVSSAPAYEAVPIPYIVWQRHRPSEKEPFQYYTIEQIGRFKFNFLIGKPTDAFEFRDSFIRHIKDSFKEVEVESIYFGSAYASIIRPSEKIFSTAIGTRAGAIVLSLEHRLGTRVTAENFKRYCYEMDHIHIILKAESRIDTLLRAIAFTSIDFLEG